MEFTVGPAIPASRSELRPAAGAARAAVGWQLDEPIWRTAARVTASL